MLFGVREHLADHPLQLSQMLRVGLAKDAHGKEQMAKRSPLADLGNPVPVSVGNKGVVSLRQDKTFQAPL